MKTVGVLKLRREEEERHSPPSRSGVNAQDEREHVALSRSKGRRGRAPSEPCLSFADLMIELAPPLIPRRRRAHKHLGLLETYDRYEGPYMH